MRTTRAGAVLLLVVGTAASAAETRERALPKDGTWVRYLMQSGDPQDKDNYTEATVTVSYVGSVVEDAQPCRWLEVKMVLTAPNSFAGTSVSKLLISEKDLLKSEHPYEHIRRGWMRRRDEQVTQTSEGFGRSNEDLLLGSPGILTSLKVADDQSKDIEYQHGRLRGAQARVGTRVDRRPSTLRNGEAKTTKNYTVWQHPELSMGIAEARIVSVTEMLRGDEILLPKRSVTGIYRIQDSGTGATTELREKN